MRRAIDTVAVVGSGAMGRGIAEACLRRGLTVILHDASPTALDTACNALAASLQRAAAKGQLTPDDAAQVLEHLVPSEELAGIHAANLVIEAVPERLELKLAVLRNIETSVSAETIIATNTSSIPITRLSLPFADPSRFLGLHFFNPVSKMPLVEVISTMETDDKVQNTIELFVRDQLGKTPLVVTDRPGFVVNALLIPFLLSAARMMDSGYASAEAIDEGMTLGCGHPMGPLKLSDLVGLDVVCEVADALYDGTKDAALIVPNNLRRLLERGHLGQKSGRGFYSYT
ncbi:3-hydroxyacyl-CoA dehydrogenase family protein [Pseudarthrobacter sp. H2]|uniref:3-hydroxyacyl-CoA dehydrogenase family protein n=1 Tax=Pseudarthrobacter sp. H2 TaxID=3418415 RepID=UPI003CF1A22B